MFIQICFSKDEVEGIKKLSKVTGNDKWAESVFTTHRELSIENTLLIDAKPIEDDDVYMTNIGIDVSVTECIIDSVTKILDVIKPVVKPVVGLFKSSFEKINEFASRKKTYKINGVEVDLDDKKEE